ncbi:MAG: hypothetical protein Fur0039_17600 [Rhodocyclaceae bacterium]
MKPVVLLVESVLADAESLARHLAALGLYPALARDGAQALALARSVAPALIVASQSLPDGSGFRLATRLASEPGCAGVAIVMLGRSADAGTRAWAQRSGAVEYLSKDSLDLPARLAASALRHLGARSAEAAGGLEAGMLGKIRAIAAEIADDPYLNEAGKSAVVVAEAAAACGLAAVRGTVLDWSGAPVEAEHEWLRGRDEVIIDPSVRHLWPRIPGWPGYDDVAVISPAMPLHAQYVERDR